MAKNQPQAGNTPEAVQAQVAAESQGFSSAPGTEETSVVVTSEGNLVVPGMATIQEAFAKGASNFLTSLVADGSRESQARIYNALNDNDGTVADIAEERGFLMVTDFMVYPVQIQTDSGLVDGVRSVLVTQDGETYGTVANGVFESLQKLAGIAGMAPWTPALKLHPVKKKTRNGFYTMTLRLGAE